MNEVANTADCWLASSRISPGWTGAGAFPAISILPASHSPCRW